MRSFLFLVIICLTIFHTRAQSKYVYEVPAQLADGWDTENFFSRGLDSTRVYKLFNQLGAAKHKVHSSLLVKGGKLVLEEYFGEQYANTQHDLRSATKSIISLLLGIALDKGIIEALDDPMSKYLGELKPKKNLDKRKELITIRHLLTMSTGFDCNDWDKKSIGQEDKVYRKKDWLQYTLDLPMLSEPGKTASYCSMGVVLLAEVIQRASGLSIEAFAQQHLFQPMNITNLSWGHTTKGKTVIPAAKRLYMTSRDLAKVGLLVLNKGRWGSEQLISEEWISASTAKQQSLANLDYGFLWWRIPFKVQSEALRVPTATGNGGQYIFILKEFNAVAVFTGGAYNSEESKLPFAIVQDVYIPILSNRN